jgi:CubicO group peptidase (beta-lactamase class C family)
MHDLSTRLIALAINFAVGPNSSASLTLGNGEHSYDAFREDAYRRPSTTFLRPQARRQIAMRCLVLFTIVTVWSSAASAEPGVTWKFLGASAAAYAAPISSAVEDYARQHRPTAIMVAQNVVATSGDIARKVNVRSVRKSLLSALFGIAVERGQIDIDKTLGQLGVDDTAPSLTPEEKQATFRQLLMSRSGVYHPAAYETREQKLAVRRAEPTRLVLSGTTTIGISTRLAQFMKRRRVRTSSGGSSV